jgi:hypothetical protein
MHLGAIALNLKSSPACPENPARENPKIAAKVFAKVADKFRR